MLFFSFYSKTQFYIHLYLSMKKHSTILFFLFATILINAQIITSNPVFFNQETPNIEIIFNASLGNGGLKGFSGEMYAHTGLITSKSTSNSDWKYAPAWGDNSDKYKMTSLGNDRWSLTLSPTLQAYYGLSAGEKVEKLAFVFRSKDNSKEGKDDGGADIFLDVSGNGLNMLFQNPDKDQFLTLDTTINIQFVVSQTADLSLLINGEEKKTESNSTELTYSYTFVSSGNFELVAKAQTADETASDTINVFIPAKTVDEAKPESLKDGINYIDEITVGLVLYAPRKENVFVLGDFNNWTYSTEYQMKRDGNRWWIIIDELNPQTLYA